MALIPPEADRLTTAARARFPFSQPPPLPAELAAWVHDSLPFTPDTQWGSQFTPPRRADICAAVAGAVYCRGTKASFGQESEAWTEQMTQSPAGDDTRTVEWVLVSGALAGWSVAGEVLLELVRCVVRPALRWLYRHNVFEDRTSREAEWVDLEATDVSGLLLQWLLRGCDCHRHARELSLQEETARTRCRTAHTLSRWDGREPLACFLCRATVCSHGYYRDALDDFSNLDNYCPHTLAVNEFRHGMLAKAVRCGTLRSGYVLRCTRLGCASEIDPDTDHCFACGQLTEARKPQTFWLWGHGCYRPEDCLPCQTCGFYYFLHRGACARQDADGPRHFWSPNPPRRVWVRLRNRGGELLTHRVGLEPFPQQALTAAGARQIREAVDAIPPGEVHELAAELFRETPDLRQAATRRTTDLCDVSFLGQFLEVLRAVPGLLPDFEDVFRSPDLLAIATGLFEEHLSLDQIALRRKVRRNQIRFRETILEVLARILGASLERHRGSLRDDDRGATGEPDSRLLEFIAGLTSDERADACDVFGEPVTAADIADRWNLDPKSDAFARRLLATVRAVRPGLPFDPIARFGTGELRIAAEAVFGSDEGDLDGLAERVSRDCGTVRPRETVRGVLLNVIYGANGLATDTPGEGEVET